jgi:hypothetical protein
MNEFFINQFHTISENVDNEDDASILLSMCTFAPHLDVSLLCKMDAELEEECAAIAWKEDDHDEDDEEEECYDEYSEGWQTASDDQEESDRNSTVCDSDHDEVASSSKDSESEEDSNSSQSSHDNSDASASSESVDLESWDGDRPQYCFEVDRDNLLESSLNALQDMSKCAPITLCGF